MKVFVLIKAIFNPEYGCEEYSEPIDIFSSEEEAKRLASLMYIDKDLEEIRIIPYVLK